MIHIFRIYSEPGSGSLPNLFFRAKAGSLIVPVLIPSRRNALHSGGVGGAASCSTARYRLVFSRLQQPTFLVLVALQPSSSHPSIFYKLFAFGVSIEIHSRPPRLLLLLLLFLLFLFDKLPLQTEW